MKSGRSKGGGALGRRSLLAGIAIAAFPALAAGQGLEECARRAGLPLTVRSIGPALSDSARRACGMARDTARLRRAERWGLGWFNTGRPSALSEGPVWLGRGLTIAGSDGAEGRWGPVSYSFRPVAFWSQNLYYDPSRQLESRAGDYRDPWLGGIDRPFRFGDGGYGRIDAGESFLRVDARWIGAGVSTAAQSWGPGILQPILLGGNAGGFPHVFLESGIPINIGVGRVAGRWMVGTLEASRYGSLRAGMLRRLIVGAVGTYMPPGLPGVEIGGGRIFHLYDSAHVRDMTTWTLPFSMIVKDLTGRLEGGARQNNQLASIFLRVAPPESALEMYGEFMREDHAITAREAIVSLSYDSAWLLGIRRARESGGRRSELVVEITNSRFTSMTRFLAESPPYVHSPIIEGHTVHGLPLASPALPGGGGVSVVWSRGTDAGGWSAAARVIPMAQNEEGGAFSGAPTGYYSIELSRDRRYGTTMRRWVLRVEPGYGDVPGVNLAIGLRVTR